MRSLAISLLILLIFSLGCTSQDTGVKDKSPEKVWNKAKAAAKKVEAYKYNQSFVGCGTDGEIKKRGETHGEVNYTNRTSISKIKSVDDEGTTKTVYKKVGKKFTATTEKKGTFFSKNVSVWWRDEDKAKAILFFNENDQINFKGLRSGNLRGKEVFIITLSINKTYTDEGGERVSRYLINRTEWISKDTYLPLKREDIVTMKSSESTTSFYTSFYDYHLGS